VPLRNKQDIVTCRQVVARLAADQAFSRIGQTMLVTAASELARNTVVYGCGGELTWELIACRGNVGIRLVFRDYGPGISDVKLAMTDGWTSGNGLGLGLPGTKRLVHEFSIDSAVGKGTKVTIVRWTNIGGPDERTTIAAQPSGPREARLRAPARPRADLDGRNDGLG
jgi:serine/threonine-protein kinase RsbT